MDINDKENYVTGSQEKPQVQATLKGPRPEEPIMTIKENMEEIPTKVRPGHPDYQNLCLERTPSDRMRILLFKWSYANCCSDVDEDGHSKQKFSLQELQYLLQVYRRSEAERESKQLELAAKKKAKEAEKMRGKRCRDTDDAHGGVAVELVGAPTLSADAQPTIPQVPAEAPQLLHESHETRFEELPPQPQGHDEEEELETLEDAQEKLQDILGPLHKKVIGRELTKLGHINALLLLAYCVGMESDYGTYRIADLIQRQATVFSSKTTLAKLLIAVEAWMNEEIARIKEVQTDTEESDVDLEEEEEQGEDHVAEQEFEDPAVVEPEVTIIEDDEVPPPAPGKPKRAPLSDAQKEQNRVKRQERKRLQQLAQNKAKSVVAKPPVPAQELEVKDKPIATFTKAENKPKSAVVRKAPKPVVVPSTTNPERDLIVIDLVIRALRASGGGLPLKEARGMALSLAEADGYDVGSLDKPYMKRLVADMKAADQLTSIDGGFLVL